MSNISYHSPFLAPDGTLLQTLPTWASDDALLHLYRIMLKTRLLDQKAVALQRTGQLGTYPSSLGQEAIYTAIGFSMAKSDVLCPYYRDQGAFLQRGVKEEDILRYWGGFEAGGKTHFDGYNDMPINVPIASQCTHAAGIAYAMALQNRKQAVVCTLGDGATSEGDFYEAMNAASLYKLPVVFVINNNRWAISTPLHKQTSDTALVHKVAHSNTKGIQVDGNDVIAMVDTMQTALDHCYQGAGPVLVEALTYRLCDHTTADDASRYQDEQERDTHAKNDPMMRIEALLTTRTSPDELDAIETQLKEELSEAVKAYQQTHLPPPASIVEHMYANMPLSLVEQQEALLDA